MVELRVGGVMIDIDGAVARVMIDRAEAKNALAPAVLEGLSAAIEAATEADCAVLVLRGAGGTLSAGADLKHLLSMLERESPVDGYIRSIGSVLDRLEAAPFVTVCVVGEYALAGGCEILLACDLAIVSEDAHIGDRHLEYGLLPGAGGSVRLPRALPAALARRLLFTGEMIDGATAARWGLVSHAVPAAELDREVDAVVARLSRHSGPALTAMKRLYRRSASIPTAEALAAEASTLIDHLLTSQAAAEGLVAFAGGRAPDFRAPLTVGASDGDEERGTIK